MSATKGFHAHLDGCRQCRENPMGLCAAGAALLATAATDADGAAPYALERQFARCAHCGHRAEDHKFGVYDDAEPCTWPGCGCDGYDEAPGADDPTALSEAPADPGKVARLAAQFDRAPLRDARVAPRRPDAVPLLLWRETPGFAPRPPADAP